MMKGNSGSGAAEAEAESASVPIANAPNARMRGANSADYSA